MKDKAGSNYCDFISDSLNLLPDDMLEETNDVRRKKRSWKKSWWGLAGAACVALIVCAGIKFLPPETPNDMPELPLLTAAENTGDAMGYEGYFAYDASELVNANPWNDSLEISTLPVYENPLTYDENFIAAGADENKMIDLLLDIAARLNLDTNTQEITDDFQNGIARQKLLSTDELELAVSQALTATISFSTAISLPDEYNFKPYASYNDMSAVAEYLQTEYKNLIGFDNPQVNIHGGDYDIYANQSYTIEFFDAGDTITEQIINYNFNRISFYNDEDGNLFLARIFQPDLSNKVGDYPIISTKDAATLLSNGNYLTTVPYKMPGLDYVKKTELVYRSGEFEAYYMPYYRFYVELPEEQNDNGLKSYGTYYVPAVDGAYLTNMPVWDGQGY